MKCVPNEAVKSYIAGFVDGEGCIGLYYIYKDSNRYRPTVGIYNTKKEVLDWINSFYDGGFISKRRNKTRPNDKTCYRLNFGSRKSCLDFLNDIHPYLFIKKKNAELLIEYCKMKIAPFHVVFPRAIEIFNEMKMLNKRGV